jgi:hypothetical protein
MDRAMAVWGGGAAVTLACVRPISASPAFDSRSARVQVRHYISLFSFFVNPSQGSLTSYCSRHEIFIREWLNSSR